MNEVVQRLASKFAKVEMSLMPLGLPCRNFAAQLHEVPRRLKTKHRRPRFCRLSESVVEGNWKEKFELPSVCKGYSARGRGVAMRFANECNHFLESISQDARGAQTDQAKSKPLQVDGKFLIMCGHT